jgi:hypothetical protein
MTSDTATTGPLVGQQKAGTIKEDLALGLSAQTWTITRRHPGCDRLRLVRGGQHFNARAGRGGVGPERSSPGR